MSIVEFVNKVREMRRLQKAYFQQRMKGDLIAAKQLEKEVDQALADGVILLVTQTIQEPKDPTQIPFEQTLGDDRENP